MITYISNFTTPQIFIFIIVLCALAIAVVAFIKTPASERFSNSKTVREPGVEYAPMYSKQEKIKIITKNLAVLIPVYLFMQLWFFPKMSEYSGNANCHIYGPLTGAHIVFYGVFVGIPLSVVIFLIPSALRAVKVYKLGQFPLPGEKVMELTKYTYGTRAKVQAVLVF